MTTSRKALTIGQATHGGGINLALKNYTKSETVLQRICPVMKEKVFLHFRNLFEIQIKLLEF